MNNDNNKAGTGRQRFTLAECLTWPMNEWDEAPSASDIAIDPETREATARRWLELRGVSDRSPDAAEVCGEAFSDAGLLIALNAPAAAFLEWFRRSDWSLWGATEDTGSEAWAWAVRGLPWRR